MWRCYIILSSIKVLITGGVENFNEFDELHCSVVKKFPIKILHLAGILTKILLIKMPNHQNFLTSFNFYAFQCIIVSRSL